MAEHPSGTALGNFRGAGLAAPRVQRLSESPDEARVATGLPGVDRILGGGLVVGSVVLLAGAPGIGKSTLLLQLASGLSNAGHPCLLASGEESPAQVGSRARRLGIAASCVSFVPGRELPEVAEAVRASPPSMLIVDSIQTLRDPDSDSLAGGTAQVRACADALVGLAKELGVAVLMAGHVTKDGDLAGPRTLEHAVDAVLTFEGDPRSGLRVLSGGKNRFGPEGEVAWFQMTPGGLVETEAGPDLGDGEAEPGCATALALAGRRAFALDVQALVVPTDGPPRRQVAGLDSKRFHIVAAVTDRAVGKLRGRLVRAELFGAASGGVRLDDPGADLAMAAALASAVSGVPPPSGTAFVGEISLTGAVRSVAGLDQRLAAASAAGMRRVVCSNPAGPRPARSGPEVVAIRHIRDALTWAFG